MTIKAVIFDFIGTLTELADYSLEKAEDKMFRSLASSYRISHKNFFETYRRAHGKYREIRYEQLVEITNAVWISEALNNLGCKTMPQDEKISAAVNIFFVSYLSALRLQSNARLTLRKLSAKYKLGLITNFTYAPVIHASLRKLKLTSFFNVVLVSEAVGWRKPSPKIFQKALKKLDLKADEVVYVGDTPLEDIQGAKSVGMKTVFMPSQFNSLEDMKKAPCKPEYVIENLIEIIKILNSFDD